VMLWFALSNTTGVGKVTIYTVSDFIAPFYVQLGDIILYLLFGTLIYTTGIFLYHMHTSRQSRKSLNGKSDKVRAIVRSLFGRDPAPEGSGDEKWADKLWHTVQAEKDSAYGEVLQGLSEEDLKSKQDFVHALEVRVGDITAQNLQVDIDSNSGSGDIDLINVSGDLDVNSGSGDVDLDEHSGEVSVNTGSGNVSLSDSDGEIDINAGSGDIRISSLPVPRPGDDEIRARVDACAICGTDLKSYVHGNPRIKAPRIMGHECAGMIEAVGRERVGVRLSPYGVFNDMPHYPEIDAQWSPNEKVALEVAMGAAFAGAHTRSTGRGQPRQRPDRWPDGRVGECPPAGQPAAADPVRQCTAGRAELPVWLCRADHQQGLRRADPGPGDVVDARCRRPGCQDP